MKGKLPLSLHILPFSEQTHKMDFKTPCDPHHSQTHTHGQWRMTHDIDDFQFIVHLELEGEVAMVVGVGPTPLLHTQQHTPSQIKTTAKEFVCIQYPCLHTHRHHTSLLSTQYLHFLLVATLLLRQDELPPSLPTHLEDYGADERVYGRSVGQSLPLEIPEDDATLREDGEPV